jgi:hypothetical protein
MASWRGNLYKALDLTAIQRAPRALPNKYYNWLSKFQGNNCISAETHVATFEAKLDKIDVEHMDVVMKLFILSLEEDARIWIKNLGDASIKTWDAFKKLFLEQ